MQNSESGIPLLTEVLQSPVYGIDVPERRSVPRDSEPSPASFAPVPMAMPGLPAAPAADRPVAPVAHSEPESVTLTGVATDTWRDTESDVHEANLPAASAASSTSTAPDAATLARIERDVSHAVLDKLLGRVDEVLEAQIRSRLADVLQTAVDGLACDLRAGLKQALGESVSLAVAAELAAMRDSKIENPD